MRGPRITLLGSHAKRLKDWLLGHPDSHERGAIILFRRISRSIKNLERSDRFLAVDIIEMNKDWVLESSKTHFKINMRKFPKIYFRCEQEGLELGFVHNHPSGINEFSVRDDVNEQNILHGLSRCNGINSFLISMILVDENWLARIRHGKDPERFQKIRHVSVLSDKIEIYGFETHDETQESLKRQEVAFGKPFNEKLQSLRVAVVGLGGTGSPTATMLARTGIGELIIIDGDALDKTNMNRVHGYTENDIGKKKAEALAHYINSLGLNVIVYPIPEYLGESSLSIDALSSADVVFGCTDDVQGRDYLNQAYSYYSQVLIDSGMAGNVEENVEGNPELRSQKGRVSCILPESGACLRCQRVITDQKLYNETTLKENPELLELDSKVLEEEYYIIGGTVQSPGIGPFTSITANNAVATLMNLINCFRKVPSDLRQDNIWIDFIHLHIHSNMPVQDKDCLYCGSNILLEKGEQTYRLGIPQLGKIPQNVS